MIDTIRRELRSSGLYGALAALNTRTLYRYTGVYLLEPPVLRNVCLFDRENPTIRTMRDLILRDTYCGMVGASGVALRIDDSMSDPRLSSHPARQTMQAYCGVPLQDTTNRCFGTLCHWDVRPRLTDPDEMALLTSVAPLLASDVIRQRRLAPSKFARAAGP